MATDKVSAFLKQLRTDPRAGKLLGGEAEPGNEEALLSAYAQAAKKLGYDLTEAELLEAIREKAQACRDKAEAAAETIRALSDEDVEDVSAGSIHYPHILN